MYPTSEKYKKAAKQLDRIWTLDLQMNLDSGEELHITDSQIVQNTLTFQESSTCSDNIQTGSTYSNSLTFSLLNYNHEFSDYNFNNARIIAKVGLQISDPATVAITPSKIGALEIPKVFDGTYSLQIDISKLSFDNSFVVCQNKEAPETLKIYTTPDTLEYTFREKTGSVTKDLIPTGVTVLIKENTFEIRPFGTIDVVAQGATAENILTLENHLLIFDTQKICTSGISYIKIGEQQEYFGVKKNSTFFSSLGAPEDCFWDSVAQDYIFKDENLEATVMQDATAHFEYVPLGVFIAAEVGKKLSSIPFTCYDSMYKANVPFNNLNIVFPISLSALFDLMCINLGISSTASLRNEIAALNLEINSFNTGDYTCRDIFGFIGILIGKNLRINREGQLESFWYKDVSYSTSPDTRVGNSSYEDFQVNITGISMVAWDGVSYTVGTNEQILEFDSNPLIQSERLLKDTTELTSQLMSGVLYNPCKVSFIGDPSLQTGDIIKHDRDNQDDIIVPLMSHIYKYRGAGTLETIGQIPEQNRQLTSNAKKLLNLKNQAQQDLNKGLSNMQQTILNQSDLITNALGFYPKIVYNEDGSIKAYYLMSTPEDTSTTTVWAFTSNGIGVSHTGIAGPYTSSWTNDDTIVAHVITADMIRTGVLSALDGLLTIDMTNGQFKTTTEKGTTIIEGNEITVQYWNRFIDKKPPVSYIRISADIDSPNDYTGVMRIIFASNDGTSYAYIGQDLKHTQDGSQITEIGQLTLSHNLPIKIKNSLEIEDSLVYDNLIVQRKNEEEGNTGIDFIVTK